TYIHDFVSNPKYSHLGQDLRFTAEARSQPLDWLLIRLKSTYLNQDLFSQLDNTDNEICVSGDGETQGSCLEKTLWTFAELTWMAWRPVQVRARGDVFLGLDRRKGTLTRVPNPEYRLRLELEGRF